MKIAIAGAGYVGFSLAVLLSQSETVSIVDPVQEKVDIINRGQSPIQDASVRSYIDRVHPSISASTDGVKVYADADYIIVAVPTDYDSIGKTLCTDIVESVLSQIDAVNSDAVVIIKSTLPIGFTRAANERHGKRVLYSPEFLRENQALQDHFEPDRIVIGYPPDNAKLEKAAKDFASLLSMNSHREDVPCLFTSPDEAEAIKLFSNTYLAMRVSFFNELDSFAQIKGLDSAKIIEGVSLDHRIGNFYNNPSFGYGGYCLPKDARQLSNSFANVPGRLIPAVVEANAIRKKHIADDIIAKGAKVVGVYRLTMKTGSDNFRSTSVEDVILHLVAAGISVIIYEPLLQEPTYHGCSVTDDLSVLFSKTDIILANRFSDELRPVMDKLYTRDIYYRD